MKKDLIGPNALGRRRFPRRSFKRTISLLCEGQYYIALGNDIGEGGLLLELESAVIMHEGSILLINFLMPNSGICIVKAQVRSYRTDNGTHFYGVLFLNLDYEGKKAIREYIAAKSEQESAEERKLLVS